MALSVGMLLGGVAQIVVQWPALRREGYRHQWRSIFRDPGAARSAVPDGPGHLGAAAAQINLLVNTWLATHEPRRCRRRSGYAFRLMYMPIGIFGVSVATAAIPELSQTRGRGRARRHAHDAVLGHAADAGAERAGHGRPDGAGAADRRADLRARRVQSSSTTMTAPALLFYAPGIIGYSIVKIVSPSFYALRMRGRRSS